MIAVIIVILVIIVVVSVWFVYHQRILVTRAYLMREAMRNHDFTFRIPTYGLFHGERALQETLNDLGGDIGRLVAQNEVEAWQKLTRILTHEIMNATTPISSICQTYLGNPKIVGTPYEEGIRAIHDASTGLSAFVGSYRKLTQLQELVQSDVCISELVESVRNLYSEIHWHIVIPESLIIHTDENLLRQVFMNIVKNAVEAGARDVEMLFSDNTLSISNNGKLITADVAREIFVPFFTTKTGGTGIGLALARQIMVMQGGNLFLADHPRCGYHTTFVLEFPESYQNCISNE